MAAHQRRKTTATAPAKSKRQPPAKAAKPVEHPAHLPVMLYTAPEVAVILHASVATVRKMIRLGILRSMKVGRWNCVADWTLKAYIQAQLGETAEAGIGGRMGA